MQKIKYFLSNINLANILLAGLLVAVSFFTFSPGSGVRARDNKPVAKRAAADKKPAASEKTAQDEKNTSPADYMVVAEENLFNPSRKIPEQKDQKPSAPLSKPEFVLDGTLITHNMKIAFMEDRKAPVNTPGRPNRQTPLKIGDAMSGFTLMQIDKDQVVMQRGEDKIVVALESKEKDKTRHHPLQPGLKGRERPGVVRQRAANPAPTPARRAARNRLLNMFRGMRR